MQKKWNILEADEQIVTSLYESLKVPKVLCKIFVQRGIDTYEKAKDFFRPQLTELHSPWLMKDMDKAVDRIISAFNKNEKILVFGDYDVDGTTSVACMYQFLKKNHSNLEFYIPHRYREGYGVSKAGIDYAKENGFTLIIALDCGIKSFDLINYAKEIGIEFIVCDHHLPDEILPPAIAILNPKQIDCNYPYKELCGCGVGFKLISALAEKLNLPAESAFEYLDLLATAIAADIVPMTGENRVLAFHGLIKANKNPNYGIKALCKLSGLVKEFHITNLVFMIAPRVNAAGRMDDATKAVQMFVADTEEEALHFAEQLHSDNTDRKEADKAITEEALAIINENKEWINRCSTLVYMPHWHKGVVGIVASRIIEHHYKPTIVLTKSGDVAAGSARSVPGFNLYEAIHACREHLLGYGGHFAAAGMTLELEQVDAFREKFEAVVSSVITPELLIPEICIDAEIELKDIKQSFFDIISQMEPFGPENLRPIFITRNVKDNGWSKIAKEDHIRFSLVQDNTTITGIGFRMADRFHLMTNKQPIDIVYTIDENEWNGNKNIQLKMIDIRSSESIKIN
ncbi:MAG: single-stranded-DNA-specific exonuclease RecJ [Chitinophagaceae bacterium]|nr:single-stranded-DNA-specific exonuclease RecJ [Chitinophagaceae bacterium]MBP7107855.1 single-stranded-DNA-specific exonuclease RecJ [Chitinophagaceae bacterium]MBP7315123.1 single-stranded-DNA-specific exonuclease RecJ [Chitinophagaceae bacterium]HQX96726.1 single-stranded-DNA-specific exonuclease RecJ [Chitinophagaceae bacterium]